MLFAATFLEEEVLLPDECVVARVWVFVVLAFDVLLADCAVLVVFFFAAVLLVG